VETTKQLLNGLSPFGGDCSHGVVEVVEVALVVLGVVLFHCCAIDVGFEGAVGVAEGFGSVGWGSVGVFSEQVGNFAGSHHLRFGSFAVHKSPTPHGPNCLPRQELKPH